MICQVTVKVIALRQITSFCQNSSCYYLVFSGRIIEKQAFSSKKYTFVVFSDKLQNKRLLAKWNIEYFSRREKVFRKYCALYWITFIHTMLGLKSDRLIILFLFLQSLTLSKDSVYRKKIYILELEELM